MKLDEISKKDLLSITGISYGQLYRWKRQGLIPEEWFIKKASFTGQETYFPKDLVLDRIDKILELKDLKSLEEIADIINNNKILKEINKYELIDNEIFINKDVINIIDKINFTYEDIVLLKIIDNIYDSSLDFENIRRLYSILCDYKKDIIHQYNFIYFIKNDDGVGFVLLKEQIIVEYNLPNLIKVNIHTLIDNIKLLFFL